ncbi:MAG: TIGR03905 family TSCPD domain-containing protein [Clostridia bacterium]|nr:TIGR03905 family TSCPD domain-containing protein [Clostridia bacterium]
MNSFKTHGTCSRQILFDVTDDGIVENVKFIGGCNGNLQGISSLVNGRPVKEVVEALKGIKCRNNTSCPDQLAKALEPYVK